VGEEAADALIEADAAGGCVDEYVLPAGARSGRWRRADRRRRTVRCRRWARHRYLQDQLIIFMALAAGRSRVLSGPLSLHTKTAIHYTQLLTGVRGGPAALLSDLSLVLTVRSHWPPCCDASGPVQRHAGQAREPQRPAGLDRVRRTRLFAGHVWMIPAARRASRVPSRAMRMPAMLDACWRPPLCDRSRLMPP